MDAGTEHLVKTARRRYERMNADLRTSVRGPHIPRDDVLELVADGLALCAAVETAHEIGRHAGLKRGMEMVIESIEENLHRFDGESLVVLSVIVSGMRAVIVTATESGILNEKVR